MMRCLRRGLALGLTVGLLVALPLRAQQVTSTASADSVTVGEVFELTVRALHRQQYAPAFPDSGAILGEAEVRGVVRRGHRLLAGGEPGARLDSVTYAVAVFALDSARVGPVPVGFAAGADTLWAAAPPLVMGVRSLVPADAADVQDLAPLAAFPRARWPWVLLAAVLLAVGAALFYAWRRRQAAPPPAPPAPALGSYERARRRLDALPPAATHLKPHYDELANTLRDYLAETYGLPAREQTTRGLAQALRRRPGLPKGAIDRLEAALTLADLVKFADYVPAAEEHAQALDAARAALARFEAHARPPAAPSPQPVPAA